MALPDFKWLFRRFGRISESGQSEIREYERSSVEEDISWLQVVVTTDKFQIQRLARKVVHGTNG